jgi:hypothetical protein
VIIEKTEAELQEIAEAKRVLEVHRIQVRENRVRRAIVAAKQLVLLRCWDAMISFSARNMRNRMIMKHTISRMHHRKAAAAWGSWQEFVVTRHEARETLQVCRSCSLRTGAADTDNAMSTVTNTTTEYTLTTRLIRAGLGEQNPAS